MKNVWLAVCELIIHAEISHSIQMSCGKHFTVASFENDTEEMTRMVRMVMFSLLR